MRSSLRQDQLPQHQNLSSLDEKTISIYSLVIKLVDQNLNALDGYDGSQLEIR